MRSKRSHVPSVRLVTAVVVATAMAVAGPGVRAAVADHVDFDPLRHAVVVPSDYDQTDDRYGVLYLLGGGGWDEQRWFQVVDAQAIADEYDVIIVSPCCGDSAFVDWHDGKHPYETRFVEQLVPLIDSTFRTIADRSHRAIAGESFGGYGAAILAARHPDLFVAMGTFSGAPDIRHPAAMAALMGIGTLFSLPNVGTAHAVYGDPVADELRWRERNPTDLVTNLRGMDVSASIGDGVPAEDDVHAFTPFLSATESALRLQNETFHAALTDASVAHEYRVARGVHDDRYFASQLHAWLPAMKAAFGTAASPAFDFRSAAARFNVWGWTVDADPARAPEFLDLLAASCEGVTFRGSGTTSVRTAPCFAPGQRIAVDGVGTVEADDVGAIGFDVSLGAAHPHQQFTPASRAAELTAAGSYFTTVQLQFIPKEDV